jgi:hypothetical protein
MSETILTDQHVAIIDAAAEAIIPADDFDAGVAPLGPGQVIATRVRYQAQAAQLYVRGLAALEQSVTIMFPGRRFGDLSLAERGRVLTAMRNGAAPGAAWREVSSQDFYRALRGDICFVYTTDPEVCRRLGFPGPSTTAGGYPDHHRPQT